MIYIILDSKTSIWPVYFSKIFYQILWNLIWQNAENNVKLGK